MILAIAPSFVGQKIDWQCLLQKRLAQEVVVLSFRDVLSFGADKAAQKTARLSVRSSIEHAMFYLCEVPHPVGAWIAQERAELVKCTDSPDILTAVRVAYSAAYTAIARFVSQHRPRAILVWGKRNVLSQAALLAAEERALPSLHFEKAFFPHSYVISEARAYYSPGSTLWQATREFPERLSRDWDPVRGAAFVRAWSLARQSKYPSFGTSGDESHAGILLIGQVARDAQLDHYNGDPDHALLSWCRDSLAAQPSARALYRSHPYATVCQLSHARRLFHAMPEVRIGSCGSLFDDFDMAQTIVTVNSTVGLEALLLQKTTVILDSAAFYAPLACFTQDQLFAYVDFLVNSVLFWQE